MIAREHVLEIVDGEAIFAWRDVEVEVLRERADRRLVLLAPNDARIARRHGEHWDLDPRLTWQQWPTGPVHPYPVDWRIRDWDDRERREREVRRPPLPGAPGVPMLPKRRPW